MTCRMCGIGFCVYCAGVTYRSPLAHRSSGQQSSPVRPNLANRLETKGEGTGQEPGAVCDHRVNLISHHAPEDIQEREACLSSERVTP